MTKDQFVEIWNNSNIIGALLREPHHVSHDQLITIVNLISRLKEKFKKDYPGGFYDERIPFFSHVEKETELFIRITPEIFFHGCKDIIEVTDLARMGLRYSSAYNMFFFNV